MPNWVRQDKPRIYFGTHNEWKLVYVTPWLNMWIFSGAKSGGVIQSWSRSSWSWFSYQSKTKYDEEVAIILIELWCKCHSCDCAIREVNSLVKRGGRQSKKEREEGLSRRTIRPQSDLEAKPRHLSDSLSPLIASVGLSLAIFSYPCSAFQHHIFPLSLYFIGPITDLRYIDPTSIRFKGQASSPVRFFVIAHLLSDRLSLSLNQIQRPSLVTCQILCHFPPAVR